MFICFIRDEKWIKAEKKDCKKRKKKKMRWGSRLKVESWKLEEIQNEETTIPTPDYRKMKKKKGENPLNGRFQPS